MEDRILTPERSRDIVELLRKRRGWTIARIAKATNTTTDFVRRVQSAKQNFEERDVVALAKASRQQVYRLLFDSLKFDMRVPEQRELHEFSLKVLKEHDEFSEVMLRKPQKKRRNGKRAA
jgi:hypothetical protein